MPMKNLCSIAAAMVVMLGGSSVALACDVGDIQCDSAGYRYVCQCYTTDGCQYYYSGSCTADHLAPKPTLLQMIGLHGRSIVPLATPIPQRSFGAIPQSQTP